MKKKNKFLSLLTLTTMALILIFALPVFSADQATPSANSQTPTPDEAYQKIKELKEKVAEKVSELKEKENRVIIGTIIKKDDEVFQVAINGSQENVTADSDTKLFWLNTNLKVLVLKADDLIADDYIIALGTYSHADKTLHAQTIYGRLKTFFYAGKIKKISGNTLSITDKEENLIELTSENADVFTLTKSGKTKSTISQLKKSDFVLVRGYEKKQKLISQRILIID